MNGDVLYAVLMSFGWLFLVGWLALLLVACHLAFRPEDPCDKHSLIGNNRQVLSATGRWHIHL